MISSRRAITRENVVSHYDELDHFYRDVWGDHVHHGLWLRGDETHDEAVRQLAELIG
nr:methyltransferase type 11 [Chthoniobacterales bacterium]